MVGAPHVHEAREAARALVLEVGDIGREVGVLAGRAHDDAIAVIAVRARAQPQRSVARIGLPAFSQDGEHAFDAAAVVKRALGGPDVVADAEALERLADLRQARRGRLATERVEVERPRAFGVHEAGDVVAVIAVVGHRLAQRQRANGLGQPHDLAAVVVDVVLARDGVAAEGEDAGERVTVGGLAGVPDVERSRRIRGHELDVDRAVVGGRDGAEALARGEDVLERVREPGVAR